MQTGVTVRKHQLWEKNRQLFVTCDLEIWQVILKNSSALSWPISSLMRHFITIGEFRLEL